MRLTISLGSLVIVTTIVGCAHPASASTQPPPPSAAVVAAITNAKKIFVLNGGEDGFYQLVYPFGANVCYADFYTSLQKSGRFQLVSDPAQADLVLMVEGVQTANYGLVFKKHGLQDDVTYNDPQIIVSLITSANQNPLYTFSIMPEIPKTNPEKMLAVATAINGLTSQLFAMVGESPSLPPAADLVQAKVSVPSKLQTGKRLYVMADPDPASASRAAVYVASFVDTLKASNRYTLQPSQEGADLIVEFSWRNPVGLRIRDASTMQLLWTMTDEAKAYVKGKKGVQSLGAAEATLFLDLTR